MTTEDPQAETAANTPDELASDEPADGDESSGITADLRAKVRAANAISAIGLELKGGGRW